MQSLYIVITWTKVLFTHADGLNLSCHESKQMFYYFTYSYVIRALLNHIEKPAPTSIKDKDSVSLHGWKRVTENAEWKPENGKRREYYKKNQKKGKDPAIHQHSPSAIQYIFASMFTRKTQEIQQLLLCSL